MTLLHTLRKSARKLGVEVHRYDIRQSLDARVHALIAHHRVDYVIDVGANDGGHGQELREGGYRGPILSFEPLAHAHAALVRRAAGDPVWHVAPRCALGEREGEVTIHVAGNSVSSSLLPMLDRHVQSAPQSATVAEELVPMVMLDAVTGFGLKDAKRALLKVDTQGYELPVLKGAIRTLQQCQGVRLEMSIVPLYEGQSLYREVIDHLDRLGFDLWALLPGFVDPGSGRLLQMDGLFFRGGSSSSVDGQHGAARAEPASENAPTREDVR